STTSDDGSQLLVDGRLVVDNSGPHSLATQSGSVPLHRGSHLVVLRYVQFGGDFALGWSWSDEEGDRAAVPAWTLSQQPTRYAVALAARTVDWGLRTLA